VQGRLRGESLSITVRTECAHCSKPMQIEIDSELNYSVREEGASPIVFVPAVNFSELKDPSIIDAF
jgi:hypothetical protein